MTSFDLFGQLLASLVEGEEVAADRSLLEACVKFAKITESGVEGIRLEGVHGRTQPILIEPRHVEVFEKLRDKTPAPRAVRLSPGDWITVFIFYSNQKCI